MNLVVRPGGLTENVIAHITPQNAGNDLKDLRVKLEETMLGSCVKSLIKERLYGQLINYAKIRRNRYKEVPIHYPTKRHKKSELFPLSDRSYQDLVGTNIKHEDGFIKVNRKVQLSRLLKVNRTSQLTPGNRISLPNDLSRLERKKDEEKSVSRQEAKGETSFISAVEILTKRDTTINDEKQQLFPSRSKSILPKSQQGERSLIDRTIWEILCDFKNGAKNVAVNLKKVTNEGKRQFLSPNFRQSQIQSRNQVSPLRSSGLCLNRNSFFRYINNEEVAPGRLMKLVMSYFELGVRVREEMKESQYISLLKQLLQYNPRIWAVVCFRFFDVDQDGAISCQDLFSLYRYLQFETSNSIVQDKLLKLLLQMKKLLESRASNDVELEKRKKTEQKDNQYLQEYVLKKKDVRYSDLSLVIDGLLNTRKTPKQVIDISHNPAMKFLSSYRYSILATEHNEKTRNNRLQLEVLKENVKAQRKLQLQFEQVLDELTKNTSRLKYPEFVSEGFHCEIRNIVLTVLGLRTG